MKRIDLVVFATFVVVSLGAWAVWVHRWKAHAARRDELNALYTFASGGDLDSVRRLSEYPSSEAIAWLEKLAQQRNATANSRVAAIKALGSKPSLNRAVLPPLLQIDQPFVVRHAAKELLEQRGCDESCTSATLHALHAIWGGQPTLEVQLSTQEQTYGVRVPPDLKAKVDADLHDRTEQDYSALLNTNACLTRKLLQTEYASDAAFADEIRKKVGPC